jgi:protein TonB
MGWRPNGEMSRAAGLALALHLAGAMALVCAIRYWPAVTQAPPPARLELDLAAVPVPAPVQADLPVLEQALAEAPAEARPLVMPAAAIPEARPAGIPEPAVMVTSVRGDLPSETFQMPREDVSALVARPLPDHPPVAVGPAATGEDQGGRPVSLSGIQPHYPYAARVRGEAGKVTIHLRVTLQGEVESALVSRSSGHPALDESALSATRKARFKPAEKDGQAVSAEMDLQFDFRLED